jgi:hypothetical protein
VRPIWDGPDISLQEFLGRPARDTSAAAMHLKTVEQQSAIIQNLLCEIAQLKEIIHAESKHGSR